MSAGRGLLIGDIAALLGISERRVERLLARALYKFDRALERELRPRWLFW
jgi:DNA-directed RNA polymerase specialized sigma24 family protein